MKNYYAYILVFFLITGCATISTKYADEKFAIDVTESKEISHTFYLIGDAGLSPLGGMNPALKIFKVYQTPKILPWPTLKPKTIWMPN